MRLDIQMVMDKVLKGRNWFILLQICLRKSSDLGQVIDEDYIHSEYLLKIYCVSGTILRLEYMGKTKSLPQGAYILVEGDSI